MMRKIYYGQLMRKCSLYKQVWGLEESLKRKKAVKESSIHQIGQEKDAGG